MKSLLGIGECMIELSAEGDKLWRQSFAGDVFNTLWYAKALLKRDANIGFFTALGDDPTSEEMLQFFKGVGISCDAIPRIKGGVPGLYKIHLQDGERSFSYWRDTSAAKQMMNNPDDLWACVAKADIVYLSGITMAILPDDAAETLLAGLQAALKPGAMIAFDQNIRPRLWKSEERMKGVISRTAAISDLVLPSFEDEQDIFGDVTPEATAERYLTLGAKQVIVKNGEQATLLAEGDSVKYFPVSAVSDVIDTTAAGDSFNGGYFAELLDSGDVEKAIATAQACAAVVVCNKGALVPFGVVQEGVSA